MPLADIMNADMATIGRMLRDGWAWWVNELAAILPTRWRSARKRGFVVELGPGAPAYFRDGRRVIALPGNAPVTMALPESQALVREVPVPRLPPRDTRRLIALDLDRLTPYDATQVVWDYAPADAAASPGHEMVRLAVVSRHDAEAAIAAAVDLGVRPEGIAVSAGAGTGRTEFDFAPQLRDRVGRRERWTDPRYWWAAACTLALANVALAVVLDRRDVALVGDAVAAQDGGVQLAQRLRSRVRSEASRRMAENVQAAAQDPLPVLSAATAAVPRTAWVQKLVWDGHTLRMTGSTIGGVDVEGALRRSRGFSSVRAGASDVQTPDAKGEPFDVIADARAPERGR